MNSLLFGPIQKLQEKRYFSKR